MRKAIPVLVLSLALLAMGPGGAQQDIDWSGLISLAAIRADLKFLADDITEGRAPGTRGEQIAAKYIAARFEMMGLEPAGDRGTYFQAVPLIGVTTEPDARLIVQAGDTTLQFRYGPDMVAWPDVYQETVTVERAPLVFVGYGVRAPEYRWDDYKGQDMTGKVLVMLVNDPPATPAEPDLFEGRAMTYYGRWTYKYEEAARQRAAGAILIHVTEMAGYPWQVVESSWTGEQVHLDQPERRHRLLLEGWITRDAAVRLFRLAGYDLERMMKQAARRDFQPVDLKATVTIRMRNRLRRFQGLNVVGLVRGRDPERKQEALVFTSHYDHLGRGPAVNDDDIYNGAYDNASGVATLLAIARAWQTLATTGPGPKRSALFLAVTAEEAGLLGSLYYAQHPTWPRENIVANLNMDSVNVWGPTADMNPLGYDRTTLDTLVAQVARQMHLQLIADPFPEKGYYFRSDHFSFARFGIPAISFDAGTRFIGKPEDWGKKLAEEYVARRYHQPSDEYDPSWPLTGARQMGEFIARIGWALAQSDVRPTWKPGREVRIPD